MHRRQIPVTEELPSGYRVLWCDRGRLAVAKPATVVDPNTVEADFPALLLREGLQPEDDQFLEVHVYGPISIHTVEGVSLKPGSATVKRKALQERLGKFGIRLVSH